MADWYFRNQQSQGGQGGLKVCPGCRNLVRSGEEFCPYCARRLRPASGIRGAVRKILAKPDIATTSLIGLIAFVFLLQIVADLLLPARYKSPGGMDLFSLLAASNLTYVRMGSNLQHLVAVYGEYWRFLTYCFLHLGLIHIGFNCYAFWDLGRLAERMWGARQVFATFILTGIGGGAASYIWNVMAGRPANSLGASGAICGILGLLLGAYYRNRHHVGQFLGSQLIRWAVYILVFGLVVRADNAAHIGGMLSGGLLGYFLAPTNRSRHLDRDMKIWNAMAIVSFILMIVCFGFAVAFYAQGPQYAVNLLR